MSWKLIAIGPDKKIRLILIYPMTTGGNFDEVLLATLCFAVSRSRADRAKAKM